VAKLEAGSLGKDRVASHPRVSRLRVVSISSKKKSKVSLHKQLHIILEIY